MILTTKKKTEFDSEYKKGLNEEDQQIIESYMKGETPRSVLDNISSDNGIVCSGKIKKQQEHML